MNGERMNTLAVDEAASLDQGQIDRQLQRLEDEERELERLSPLAVDLSKVKQETIKGPGGEPMTRKEAIKLAQDVNAAANRRKRFRGRVKHGRTYAVPKKRPLKRTRHSA